MTTENTDKRGVHSLRRFKWKSWLAVFTAAALFAGSLPVQAGTGSADHKVYDYSDSAGWPSAPSVTANSVYMIELNSGTVIYEKNPDLQSFPASTTKVMTALLTLENCGLEEEVTFSHDAVTDIEEGGNHWEFQEGEVLSVDECMQFLLVESVNEVAYALAEHIDGSLSAFADRMNERARELGAQNTHFNNPHGLNDSNHYTTARDMAMILWGCVQNEKFQMYGSLPTVRLKGRAIQTEGFSKYTNHNKMILPDSEFYYEDVVAGKTGYTSLAGNTLVTYARRGDMDVVCALMKGGSDRFNDMTKLLNYAFDNFQLVSAEEIAGKTSAASLTPLGLTEKSGEDSQLLLPKGADLANVASEYTPAQDGGLGTRTWTYLGNTIREEAVSLEENPVAKVTPEVVGESSGEGSAAGTEVSPAGDTAEEVPEVSSEAGLVGGWHLREVLTLAVLGVLFLFLLILLIHLLRARARARRRRRRRAQARRQQRNYRSGNRR